VATAEELAKIGALTADAECPKALVSQGGGIKCVDEKGAHDVVQARPGTLDVHGER
jgi:hypothetical protein